MPPGFGYAKRQTSQKTRSGKCWPGMEGVYCITRAMKMIRQCFPRHSGKCYVFAASQWSTSPAHPFNFLYETRLYCGNAILEILCRRLKNLFRDGRIWVYEKASDLVMSWTFVQKLLLAGLLLINRHFQHPGVAKLWLASRRQRFEEPHAAHSAFLKIIYLFFTFYFYCKVSKHCKMVLWNLALRIVLLCHSKKNWIVPKRIMMSQKLKLQINSCFQISMWRVCVTWVLQYAART